MSKKRKRGNSFKSLSNNSNYLLGRVISDLRVASLCKQDVVEIPYSKYVQKFINFLYRRGLIISFFVYQSNSKKIILIVLRYFKDHGFLQHIKLFSKPSKTIFFSFKKIVFLKRKTSVFSGGCAVFSTSFGILDVEMCIRSQLGGVYICFIPFLL
jgi:ribosomal protein S8